MTLALAAVTGIGLAACAGLRDFLPLFAADDAALGIRRWRRARRAASLEAPQ